MSPINWEEARSAELKKRHARGESALLEFDNLGDEHPFYSQFRVKGTSNLSYYVEINSLGETGLNSCTCMDYKYNGLGTCKHIEAVLTRLKENSTSAFEWTKGKQPIRENSLFTVWQDGVETLYLTLDEEKYTEVEIELFENNTLKSEILINSDKAMKYINKNESGLFIAPSVFESIRRNGERIALYNKVNERLKSGLPPNILKKPLKAHQNETVTHMLKNPVSMINEEFGTGKRISALGAASFIKKLKGNAKMVIITNPNYYSHWKRLIKIFSPQGVHSFDDKLVRNAPDPFTVKPVFLTSFHKLLRDGNKIQNIEPTIIVVDEIMEVGKWKGKVGSILKSLDAPYKFIFSSKDIKHNKELLLNAAQYMFPHKLGPLWKYYQNNVIRNEYGKAIDFKSEEKLFDIIKPAVLSRDFGDIKSSMPKKSKIRVILSMNENQRNIMNAKLTRLSALSSTRFEWSSKDLNSIITIIRKIRIGLGDFSSIYTEPSSTPKLEYLLQLFKHLKGSNKKIAIQTHWEDLVKPITEIANLRGYEVSRIRTFEEGEVWSSIPGDGIAIVVDKDSNVRLTNLGVVINYDLPWTKALVKHRRVCVSGINGGHYTEFNMVVAGSVEERAMVVMNTLPKLIGEWFDENESVTLPEPQIIRNLIKKLVGRRDERISSSKMSNVERTPSRERKMSLRKIRDMSRPLGRSKERLLAAGFSSTKNNFKKSILYDEVREFPISKDDTILINFITMPGLDGIAPVFVTTFNPFTGVYNGFSKDHFKNLGEQLTKCELVIGAANDIPMSRLLEVFFPENSSDITYLDLSIKFKDVTGTKVGFLNICEASLGKSMKWDENEIIRLFSKNMLSDLAELGQADIRSAWSMISLISREQKFYSKVSGHREEFSLNISSEISDKLLDLFISRQNIQ